MGRGRASWLIVRLTIGGDAGRSLFAALRGETQMDSLEYWNMRAESFGGTNAQTHASGCTKGYMPRFIELLALEDGQSVFDMGCATGTLAAPLAREGHSICARDFSPRMIDRLQQITRDENLPIDAAVMAWEDDRGGLVRRRGGIAFLAVQARRAAQGPGRS